jgi:hypothetical protein
MEETLNISIDFVSDMVAWRDASDRRSVRMAGIERKEHAELPAVTGVKAVRALLDGIDA